MRYYTLRLVPIFQLCFIILTEGGLASTDISTTKACDRATDEVILDDNKFCDATTATSPVEVPKNDCFRAAVVDYSRVDAQQDCRISVQQNLEVYNKISSLARDNDVQMLVFPEDGILYGTDKYVQPCLEEIPDPVLHHDYNPCMQPDRFNLTFPILNQLSCLAKDTGLYVIANYGTKEKRNCDSPQQDCDSSEPERGVFGEYLMLNTDVVFDPTGKYIRRYRKWHPFSITEIFTKAPKLEHIYFDTDFGRFGVFTCFDILFKEPALSLVERYHIDTAIFPTWWFDEIPILSAIQFQDGWSSTARVNLLASNILKPELGSTGSGIFSNNRSFYVAPDLDSAGRPRKTKLLISTIQTKRQSGQISGDIKKTEHSCSGNSDSKIIEIDDNATPRNYSWKNYEIRANDTVRKLDKSHDAPVCAGKVCCSVSYKLTPDSDKNQTDRVVVVVRDARRQGGWYEQVCTVATLKQPYVTSDSDEPASGLTFDFNAAVGFESLTLRATFSTRYVFPSCAHNLTRLVERGQRNMNCNQMPGAGDEKDAHACQLDYTPNNSDAKLNKLYSFGMYARVYERDLSSL